MLLGFGDWSLGGAVVVEELDIDLDRGCSWRGGTLKNERKNCLVCAATSCISCSFSWDVTYTFGEISWYLKRFLIIIPSKPAVRNFIPKRNGRCLKNPVFHYSLL